MPIAVMKPVSFTAALFGLLSPVIAGSGQSKPAASSDSPAEFKPPQVFKNTNLVHIISLEKNYVKEQINVLVENTSKEPQDEYYLPFTTEQIARVGGFEAKDRKDTSSGQFTVEAVEYDPNRYSNSVSKLLED